jgi:hypothetical protein
MSNRVAQGGLIVKSPKLVVPMLIALTLAAMLGGCSKNAIPTGVDPALDMAPPAIPAQITAEIEASTGSVALGWTASSSANAASYEIYQYSPNPKSTNAYVLVGQTDAATTTCSLSSAPQRIRYYRLRTVSSTGVKSELSAFVSVTDISMQPAGGGSEPSEPTEPGAGVKTKP